MKVYISTTFALLVLLLGISASPSVAFAQEKADTAQQKADAATAQIVSGVQSATSDGPTSPPSAVSLTSSTTSSSASASFGYIHNIIRQTKAGSFGEYLNVQIGLSTPIAKNGAVTEPATLAGIPNATAITGNLALLIVSPIPSAGPDAQDGGDPCIMMSEGLAIAAHAIADTVASAQQCYPNTIIEFAGFGLAARFMAATSTGGADATLEGEPCQDMLKGFADIVKTSHKPGNTLGGPCSAALIEQYGGLALADRYNAAMDLANSKRFIWKIGSISKVGYEDDTYYAPVTLLKLDNKGVPWQLGFYGSYISGAENWAITAEYLHQQSFTQTPTTTSCLSGAGPTLKCISGSIGKPATTTKDIVSAIGTVQYNTSLNLVGGFLKTIGFAPEIDADARNKTYGASLPIFLLGDKTGLTGGIRVDWTSVQHKVVVGVFVTQPFGVIQSPAPS